MKSWKIKAVSAFLVLSVFGVITFPILQPKKAEASIVNCAVLLVQYFLGETEGTASYAAGSVTGVPVTNPLIVQTSVAEDANSNQQDNFKTSCLDGIGWMLAKIAVAYITQSIVQWINSGFNGSPTFIADPKGFLLKVADEQFANILGAMFPEAGGLLDTICSPFSINLKLKLALKFNFNYKRLGVPTGCSLTDISNNISGAVNGAKQDITSQYNDYTNGNFHNGGWDRWFQISQNAANNKYGADLNADLAMNAAIEDAQGQETSLLDANNWFKSLTSGTSSITSAVNSVITPGKTIEGMLSQSVGNGVEQLNIADSIDEIIGALISQLMNKIIGVGVTGLSESDPNNGGKSYADQIIDETNQQKTDTDTDRSGSQLPTRPTPPPPPKGNPTMLSINLNASQSSTYVNEAGTAHPAANAVDGITNTGTVSSQLSATNNENQGWWEVDLGVKRELTDIKIFPSLLSNYQLTDFYIIVSDNPFTQTAGGLQQALTTGTWNVRVASIPNPPYDINILDQGVSGRYVRIQRAGAGAIILNEVQVFGYKPGETTGTGGGSTVIVPVAGQPLSSNTGPQTTNLTAYNGPTDITQDGTVIDGKTINGHLNIKANNVTIRNSKISAGWAPYGINATFNKSNLKIENNEISDAASAAVVGSNYVASGNNIHDTRGDGFKATNNVTIANNYVTRLGESSGAHADGVQVEGGSNVSITGNFFDMPRNTAGTKSGTCVLVNPTASNITTDKNWCLGGNFAMHMYCSDSGASCSSLKVTNNTFYAGMANGAQFGFGNLANGVVWSGNVDQDGNPVDPSDK